MGVKIDGQAGEVKRDGSGGGTKHEDMKHEMQNRVEERAYRRLWMRAGWFISDIGSGYAVWRYASGIPAIR